MAELCHVANRPCHAAVGVINCDSNAQVSAVHVRPEAASPECPAALPGHVSLVTLHRCAVLCCDVLLTHAVMLQWG